MDPVHLQHDALVRLCKNHLLVRVALTYQYRRHKPTCLRTMPLVE